MVSQPPTVILMLRALEENPTLVHLDLSQWKFKVIITITNIVISIVVIIIIIIIIIFSIIIIIVSRWSTQVTPGEDTLSAIAAWAKGRLDFPFIWQTYIVCHNVDNIIIIIIRNLCAWADPTGERNHFGGVILIFVKFAIFDKFDNLWQICIIFWNIWN